MQHISGCREAPGCAGEPTHIYRPQGGQPVAYCTVCMPNFLRSRVSTMETTAALARKEREVLEAVSVPEEPKKTRRSRKKATPVVEEPVVEEAIEDPEVVVDAELAGIEEQEATEE